MFKRLFCKHDFKFKSQHMRDGGMGKSIVHKCVKCGKVKIELI